MNFLGLGPGELMLVLILALIVFGPGKLPEIGSGVGKAIREFRRATEGITQELNRELSLDAPPSDSPKKAATPAQESAPTTEPVAQEPAAPAETVAQQPSPASDPVVESVATNPEPTVAEPAQVAVATAEEPRPSEPASEDETGGTTLALKTEDSENREA